MRPYTQSYPNCLTSTGVATNDHCGIIVFVIIQNIHPTLTTTQHNSNLPASHHPSCHNNRLAGSFDGDRGVGRCRLSGMRCTATSSFFNSVRAILQPSLSTSSWLTGVSGCESDGVSDDGSAWTFGGALIVGGFLGAAGRKNESSRATCFVAPIFCLQLLDCW